MARNPYWGEDTERWRPAGEHENFNPRYADFRWNKDFTEFQLKPLRWWDDASYIAYQTGADTEEYRYDDAPEAPVATKPRPEPAKALRCQECLKAACDCDGIPLPF